MKADDAKRAWMLMQDFVDAQNRRSELNDALGFSMGGGRGKLLMHLRNGPTTLRELADAIGVDAPYATLMADKLEELMLLERRPHPDDKRRKLVTLTAKGERTVATTDAIWQRPPAALSKLSRAELHQLALLLERLH